MVRQATRLLLDVALVLRFINTVPARRAGKASLCGKDYDRSKEFGTFLNDTIAEYVTVITNRGTWSRHRFGQAGLHG